MCRRNGHESRWLEMNFRTLELRLWAPMGPADVDPKTVTTWCVYKREDPSRARETGDNVESKKNYNLYTITRQSKVFNTRYAFAV